MSVGKVFLIPYSFDGTLINGTNEIDSQKFQLPVPTILNAIINVAGGNLLDLNYGTAPKMIPAPFNLVMMVKVTTDAIHLATYFDAFFGYYPQGKYGKIATFIAKPHAKDNQVSCQAQLSKVEVSQDGNWYEDDNLMIVNVNTTFKPTTLFEDVV